ncbi:hypothetical protein [Desulfovibrio gilichinskyi]|uniref:DUF91 domain-containing protein n=1 Tax=Desulfovibrio gilichinskyi TaxID=1519643 RepID=A0A1X7EWH6_9BACT|nr:hypothetical protein [Desulfovibrio gilichinskyi]SMF41158.1 hypothetical protein SAMN06295933_3396 [Desulfovibrio gilichinskyi]
MVTVESEKEVEEYLCSFLEKEIRLSVLQQPNLGSYGIADIIAWTVINEDDSRTLLAHVIEVKKGKAGVEGLAQLCRYMKAVELSLNELKNENFCTLNNVLVQGMLICEDLFDPEAMGFLLAQMQNVYLYKYTVTMDKGLIAIRWPGWIKGPYKNDIQVPSVVTSKQIEKKVNEIESGELDWANGNPYNLFHEFCV